MACHGLQEFDLAELTACYRSPAHFTRHLTLPTAARDPGPSEQITIDPGWKPLIPTLPCTHLKFSLLGCQIAFNNQLFSGWFLLVSTGLLIYLIINVHVLYWRLLMQDNLFAVAIPNSTNNQEKGPSVTKVTSLPAEVLFNLTVCKLTCSLLQIYFWKSRPK